MRQQSIARRAVEQPASASFFERQKQRLGGTIYEAFKPNRDLLDCAFCYGPMTSGQRIKELACNELHQFHESPCFESFINYCNTNNTPKLCPLCRIPIDENAVKTKVF